MCIGKGSAAGGYGSHSSKRAGSLTQEFGGGWGGHAESVCRRRNNAYGVGISRKCPAKPGKPEPPPA